jgi:hypothetical protein
MRHGRIKVSVTEEDILRGKRLVARACPIARAIRRDARMWKRVSVYGNYCNYYDSRGWFMNMSKLPKKCETFVNRFDEGKKVNPFSFIIRLP